MCLTASGDGSKVVKVEERRRRILWHYQYQHQKLKKR